MNSPKVSVCIMAYNHEKYISQSLDSALMQQTTFPVEIILGEDESADDTRRICIEYANKFPDKIRLFLRSRKDVIYINGKATGRFNFFENLKKANGKYIAILDGDDYWTDPFKLQKQVDFLEANPQYTICYHKIAIINDSNAGTVHQNAHIGREISLTDLCKKNFIPPLSCVFKNIIYEYPQWLYYKAPYADWPLFLLLAEKGKIKFLNDAMGVYRVHSGGLWSQLQQHTEVKNKIKLIKLCNHHFQNKYRDQFYSSYIECYIRLLFLNLIDKKRSFGNIIKYKKLFNYVVEINKTRKVFPHNELVEKTSYYWGRLFFKLCNDGLLDVFAYWWASRSITAHQLFYFVKVQTNKLIRRK